jgi:plastocyanin
MPRFLIRLFAFVFAALGPAGAHVTAGNVRVEIRDPKGAPVGDAVASLVPLDAQPVLQPPAEPVVIVQINEEFQPYVTAVIAGTRVSFPNRDKVQHHVYSQSKAKAFEIPLYRGEAKEPVRFDQPGVVALGCNIHDWMSAYVVVLATPHFARSGADGLVPLSAVPAGRYRLEVWHPRATQMVTREIAITGEFATQVIAVTLRADRRIRRAPEAGAGGYK